MALLVAACDALEYAPPDASPVQANASPFDVVFDLASDADTLLLWGDVQFTYQLDIGEKKLDAVRLYVEDSLLATSTSLASLTFRSVDVADGVYPFRFEIWTRAGSSSVLNEQLTRTGIIQNALPEPIELQSIEPRDGSLRLSWEPSTHIAFKEYNIYEIAQINGQNRRFLRATIADRNTTTWYDPYYLGGAVTYQVEGSVQFGSPFFSPQQTFTSAGPTINVIEEVDPGRVRLAWTPCLYPANFVAYILERRIGEKDSDFDYEEIARITDLSETAFVDESFGFGSVVGFRVRVEGQGFIEEKGGYVSETRTLHRGEPITTFYQLQYVAAHQSYYLLSRTVQDERTVHRFDAPTFEERATASDVRHMAITGEGRVFVFSSIDEETQPTLQELDPLTLQPIQTLPTAEVLGYPSIPLHGIRAIDPATIVYSGFTQQSGIFAPDSLITLDLDGRRLLARQDPASLTLSRHEMPPNLSADGRFALIRSALYRIEDHRLFPVASFDSGNEVFFMDEGRHLVVVGQGEAQIVRTEDVSIVRTFAAPIRPPYTLDVAGGYLGGVVGTSRLTYQVYSFEGVLKHDIPIVAANGLGTTTFVLANKTLFSTNGYYVSLD